uniref:Uncharacterized protein n=1 Tax=Anopheles minimus TaxID=112268 RepID=A0A182WNN0_9DIPT
MCPCMANLGMRKEIGEEEANCTKRSDW